MIFRSACLLLLSLAAVRAEEPCMAGVDNKFTVKLNIFAGELGYYQIEECGDQVNPTLGMEIGETYTFVQTDPTNYYHPMGFAYFPDGAHDGVDELEPGITQTSSNTCANDMTCSAPMYFMGDKYLGVYSNIPEVADVTMGEDNFGLDEYEPLFFHPLPDWASYGDFSVKLRFTDEDYDKDIFYFCHIHQFMTGRIKLLKSGVKVSEEDTPAIEYSYDELGEFDKSCGTYDLDGFTLPQSFCPEEFVCVTNDATDEMKKFAACIDAMNCHMFAGMTTSNIAGSANALFMHQMIPHHQNAVNMAKTLLHTGVLDCQDVTEETEDCLLTTLTLSIITGQNFQIQTMKNLLAGNPDYPDEDNCELDVELVTVQSAQIPDNKRQLDGAICTSENNVFTAKVNLHAGELGYYQFEECGDTVNPTLGIEIGETYTFVQTDPTNYFHPMGFAYFPDGAHDDVDELEPGITQTGSNCAADNSCSAPMYFIGEDYQGDYSNIAEVANVTSGEDNFGLDEYEPLFFHPFPDWLGYGEFNIKLRFDDADYDQDIFYFCHIHQYMTGRIKLLQNGVEVNTMDTPAVEYTYDEPGAFDESCGTFALDDFSVPLDICPDYFVCTADGASGDTKEFAACIDAMNCQMLGGMTTNIAANSESALFMHQMIPHHQNAVNMAKALLFSGSLNCEDLRDETEDCILQSLVYEIVNGQNFQIQTMKNLLANNPNYTVEDNCDVKFPEDAIAEAPEDAIAEAPEDAIAEAPEDAIAEAPSPSAGSCIHVTAAGVLCLCVGLLISF